MTSKQIIKMIRYFCQIYEVDDILQKEVIAQLNNQMDLEDESLEITNQIQNNSKSQISYNLAHKEKTENQKTKNQLLQRKVDFFLSQISQNLPPQVKEDPIIKSPLNSVLCQLCQKNGNRKTSGRLLNFDIDKWVHSNCALFSEDVQEQLDGVLFFEKLFKKSQTQNCYLCLQSNATIHCFQGKWGCRNKMHFTCAIQNDCVFLSCKRVLCHHCKEYMLKQGQKLNPNIEYFYKNPHVTDYKFVNNFNSNRKLQIKATKDRLSQLEYNEKCFKRIGTNTFINIGGDPEIPEIFQNLIFLKTLFDKKSALNKIFSFQITLAKKNQKKKNLLGFKIKSQKIKNEILYQSQNQQKKNNLQISSQSQNQGKFPFLYQKCEMTEQLLFSNSTPSQIIYSVKKFQQFIQQSIQENSSLNSDSQSLKELKTLDHEVLCDLIGINNQIVQYWIQNGDQVSESNGTYKSIKEYYYQSKSVEHINYFEKQKTLEKILSTVLFQRELNPNQKDQQQVELNLLPMLKKKQKNLKLKETNKENQNQIVEKKIKAKKNTGSEFSNLNKISLRVQDLLLDGNWIKDITQTKEKEFEKKMEKNYQIWQSQKQHKHLNVYVAPSLIHKYGLFTKKKFEKDDIVIEYVGEKIRNVVADSREIYYEQQGFGDCYLFRANKEFVIDATFRGNEARYLNHSCDPTCSSIILEIDEDPKIIIYAKREIQVGEEITYDYHFEAETEKLKCSCGAENCQGILN